MPESKLIMQLHNCLPDTIACAVCLFSVDFASISSVHCSSVLSLCFLLYFSFLLFFQAVSPQLPLADSSDISYLPPFFFPTFLPPLLREYICLIWDINASLLFQIFFLNSWPLALLWLCPWWILPLLYGFICAFYARFCHCCVVLLLCCVPPSSSLIFNTLNILNLTMLSPSSFLPSSFYPPFSLGASSHIHLPVLCLCLSILWCDPRRHGRKVDELRSVPSQPFHPPILFNSLSWLTLPLTSSHLHHLFSLHWLLMLCIINSFFFSHSFILLFKAVCC